MYTVTTHHGNPKLLNQATFADLDAAMRFATSNPFWTLRDSGGLLLADGSRDSYEWQRQPDNCPPWW